MPQKRTYVEGPREGQDIEGVGMVPDMFPMGWAVCQVCQENFGVFVTEIAYSPISIRMHYLVHFCDVIDRGPGPSLGKDTLGTDRRLNVIWHHE